MNPLYELLAHKMVERNIRLIRAGLTYRWFLLAFWICFAAFAITRSTVLEIPCGVLLFCSLLARIWWRRRSYSELEKLVKEHDDRTD